MGFRRLNGKLKIVGNFGIVNSTLSSIMGSVQLDRNFLEEFSHLVARFTVEKLVLIRLALCIVEPRHNDLGMIGVYVVGDQ
jgi:hypothetical protein